MLIAIDTSTRVASVALLRGDQVQGEITWQAGIEHTRELLPSLVYLLRRYRQDSSLASSETRDLLAEAEGLVVALGPGSFNGIRVALATAKGLAVARGLPLVGVSTLEAQAYQHAVCGMPIWSLLRAGREHLAAGVYHLRDGVWSTLAAPHLTTLDQLCARDEGPVLVCGEIDPLLGQEIAERLGGRGVIVPAYASTRRAAFLGELGRARLAGGQKDDIAQLQPIYLRRPHITPRKD